MYLGTIGSKSNTKFMLSVLDITPNPMSPSLMWSLGSFLTLLTLDGLIISLHQWRTVHCLCWHISIAICCHRGPLCHRKNRNHYITVKPNKSISQGICSINFSQEFKQYVYNFFQTLFFFLFFQTQRVFFNYKIYSFVQNYQAFWLFAVLVLKKKWKKQYLLASCSWL